MFSSLFLVFLFFIFPLSSTRDENIKIHVRSSLPTNFNVMNVKRGHDRFMTFSHLVKFFRFWISAKRTFSTLCSSSVDL